MAAPIGSGGPQKEWTILYYFDGKNNLASMAKHSFSSLDAIGSDDSVNLVAQIGLPGQDVEQGLVLRKMGTTRFQSIGAADMGSARNVQDFLEWGMTHFPAKNYAVVFWNHGAGFKGCNTDDETGHIVRNEDLAAAMKAAEQKTGKRVNIINFNACLMNQAEVAYELKDCADYMIGSEEVEAGLRIPIPGVFGTTPQHEIVKDLQAKQGKVSPEELAKLFVFEAKNQFGTSLFTPTQSAIDLSKMDNVHQKTDELSGLLLNAIRRDPGLIDTLRSDIKKAQHYLAMDAYVEPYVDYRDLGDFARVIEANADAYGEPGLKAACNDLKAAIKDAVIAEHHTTQSGMGGRSLEGSTGMSVYLPRDYGFDRQGKSAIDNVPNGGTHGHEETTWAKTNRMEELIKAISKDDDWKGRFPRINRMLMTTGQIAGIIGYQDAWEVLSGLTRSPLISWFPLMGFPYILPVPGVLMSGIGAIGGALRLQKGVSKLAEGITRSESAPENRRKLVIDGVLDTAIGAGSIVTCGAMIAGLGASVVPVAAGVMALGVGRMLYSLASGWMKKKKAAAMSVDEKIAAMADARPNLKVTPPPAQPAPAKPVAAGVP